MVSTVFLLSFDKVRKGGVNLQNALLRAEMPLLHFVGMGFVFLHNVPTIVKQI